MWDAAQRGGRWCLTRPAQWPMLWPLAGHRASLLESGPVWKLGAWTDSVLAQTSSDRLCSLPTRWQVSSEAWLPPWFPSFHLSQCVMHEVACELSCFQLFVISRPVAHQPPLSMGIPRQEYWSGLQFPPPGDFLGPRIEPSSSVSPHCRHILYCLSHRGSPLLHERRS